jgi:hypothetical protein
LYKLVVLATVRSPAKKTLPLKRLTPLNVELESVTPLNEVTTAGGGVTTV